MDRESFIAEIRHLTWWAYMQGAGHDVPLEMTESQRESLLDGIRWRDEHPEATAEENHNNWMRKRLSDGWRYGPVKDETRKTHPDLIPFDRLPREEAVKDTLDLIAHDKASELYSLLEGSNEKNV